jgi:hypothetical protein
VFALFSWLCFLWGFELREEEEEFRLTSVLEGRSTGGKRGKKYNIS